MLSLETFYQSKRWARLRETLMLARQDEDGQIICAHCGKPIVKKCDCIAHHVIELTDDNVNDYDISFNPENIILVHFRCHNEIHQRWNGFRQYVYLVWGSPCAGKTTWVNENAYDDDLIVDVDRIWESVCNSDRLHKPNRLKANVFAIRDALIDQIRTRTGKWRNAFVVGTYPLEADRERLCSMLHAIPIYINATREDCMMRAPSEDWKQYVADWWEEVYPPVS